jgi:hypothetical protein
MVLLPSNVFIDNSIHVSSASNTINQSPSDLLLLLKVLQGIKEEQEWSHLEIETEIDNMKSDQQQLREVLESFRAPMEKYNATVETAIFGEDGEYPLYHMVVLLGWILRKLGKKVDSF